MSKQKRLEEVITAYWEIGTALRHPSAKAVSTERALKLLNQSDRLNAVAGEHKLGANMHTLKYDIIEGNTEWRKHERQEVTRLASILHMKR